MKTQIAFVVILGLISDAQSQESHRFVSRSDKASENINAIVPNPTASTPTLEKPTQNPFFAPQDSSSGFLQGIALPRQDGNLTVVAPSTVKKIFVEEGALVNAGDPIIGLDSRVAEAAVAVAERAVASKAAMDQAELAMNSAKSLLLRTEKAFRAGASGEFELEANKNAYEQSVALYQFQVEQHLKSKAELKLAEAELATKILRAPFAGTVVAIPAKLGSTLQPAELAARIVDLQILTVDMHLPTTLFGSLKRNQTISLLAAAPVNRKVSAKIRYISPVVEPTSGTFRVRFEISNKSEQLPAGFELWFPKK
ncbi:MAG: efflux RND transporter periplasmic adaptor subunit [Planctomycetota bacterium]